MGKMVCVRVWGKSIDVGGHGEMSGWGDDMLVSKNFLLRGGSLISYISVKNSFTFHTKH